MKSQDHETLRAELEDRLRFETLLTDLTAQFINLPADQVDQTIIGVQRRVCEFIGLDLSALWQWGGEQSQFLVMTHLFRAVEGPPPPERMEAEAYFPWCQRELLAGRTIIVVSMDELPPEAARDQEIWRYYLVKSALTFPLSVGGKPPIGALSFCAMKAERAWPDELVNRLQQVAHVFTSALARKAAEEVLRESEIRLGLAAEAAGAGLWSQDSASGVFWTNPEIMELFRFDPNLPITRDSFLSVVHPEDRPRINRIIEESLRENREVRAEYRIVHPDGSIHWIASWGRPRFDPLANTHRLTGISMDITERKTNQLALARAYDEIAELKERLQQENIYLRQEISIDHARSEIIGQSEAIRNVLRLAGQVAPTDSSVLIQGETGTGKELIAKLVHQLSPRHGRLMVKVNCTALPETLIESELFGREKGAFTGALTRQTGRFEMAHGSTLFLDEIGELPLELQAKLLQVIQEGRFERLGSTKTISVDVRVIAATNRDLANEVRRGRFRQDLYYRINVFPIHMPPLRERVEDIPLMVSAFVDEFSKKFNRKINQVPRRVMDAMLRYSWPGNIRELRNIIERALIVSPDDTLAPDLPSLTADNAPAVTTLAEAETRHIRATLKRTGGRIKGANGAAALLGMKPSTLYTRMKKLGIHIRD